MNKAILIASVLAFALGASSTGHSCDEGYAISVLDDGNCIKLDEGSLCEVNSVDAVMSWSTADDVLVCDDKIINAYDEELVLQRRMADALEHSTRTNTSQRKE